MNLSVLDPLAEVAGDLELPCRSFDPELFFAELPADVEFAKSVCHDCPIRQDCLQGALARREPWGVWGGQLFVAGVVVPRKRPRGRPRKDDAARDAMPAGPAGSARSTGSAGPAGAAGQSGAAAPPQKDEVAA